MTYDQATARILLSSRPEADKRQALAGLAREVAHATGAECPECGSHDTEDNGSTEYRCVACDHRWGDDGGHRYGY